MNLFKILATPLIGAAIALAAPALAEETVTVKAPGIWATGSTMDYMKSVYDRVTFAELMQLPIASFDKEYHITPLAAESWTQSEDGLTWTFKLRPGLVWSDGEALKAVDYVYALQRAATEGYDFAWYWDLAAGIKGWKEVTEGKAGVETLGLKAVDDLTIELTTLAPKPYLPSVASLWFPIPKHQVETLGDAWALNTNTMLSSGPFKLESWEKSNNSYVMAKSESYTGPWQAQIDRLVIEPALSAAEVGFPAFLAKDVDYTYLNTGQLPMAKAQFPDELRQNAVFATSYLAFDLDAAPFDNPAVRQALYYAVDREELTSTVLRDIAIPAGSILPPAYPGYNPDIVAKAVFDPGKARALLAEAGYPDGKGFPEIELWIREEGNYNSAITPPMAQYLQAEFKEHLGITINIRQLTQPEWLDGLRNRKNNLFMAPYEYDYLDPSNFFSLFVNGGRHNYNVTEFDTLIAKADSESDVEVRAALYEQAEQVMIDQGMFVPLIHPVTMAVISTDLKGDGATPNARGFTPFDRLVHYFSTHITK